MQAHAGVALITVIWPATAHQLSISAHRLSFIPRFLTSYAPFDGLMLLVLFRVFPSMP